MKKKKKVIVAMSGGVDSSVSAYLLLKKGYRVEGLFMKNWEEDDTKNYCSALEDLKDARIVSKKIGIYLHEVNFSSEYWDQVFESFLYELKNNKTPNPDILCNQKIKFGVFYNFAINQLKFDYIATGHYAQIKYFNNQPMLIRNQTNKKDQSYFLYTLKKNQLKKIIFPVGKYNKLQVREIAKKNNLHNSEKPDSTGICFIGPKNMQKFLKRFIPVKRGNIVTNNGYIIGTHNGLFNYTIGQRRGIKVGGKYDKKKLPWYVIKKDNTKNTLVIDQGINNKYLMSIGLIAKDVNWINDINIANVFNCTVKTRYYQNEILCKLILFDFKHVKIIFNQPVSSITPGQSVVFYKLQICLGGGIIKKSIPFIEL